MSTRRPLLHEATTKSIIGAFYELYNELGYGFFESVYANGMEQLLKDRGHRVEREVIMKVYLYGKVIGTYKADKLIDGVVVLEHKAGRKLPVGTYEQVYNALRCTDLEVALILHFGPEPKFYRLVSSDLKNH